MGGSVFASGPNPLYTPRMPRAVYIAVREQCHDILRKLFWAVASPIDGPGKLDFGDVDILLSLPKETYNDTAVDQKQLLDTALGRLGSVRSSIVAHEGKASLAIPWPPRFADLIPEASTSTSTSTSTPHIQVDLAFHPSLPRFHWALFKHAHGDFWNIIGSAVLRPLGFTVDERALWLRVPEIEQHHRNRAKIFLSSEPAVVLEFLQLNFSESQWDAPFDSATELFEYCTACRFFALPSEQELTERLKANDRRRLAYRPLFRQWATEFVPQRAREVSVKGNTVDDPTTRETARDAAFRYFSGSQARFEEARTSWLRERHLLAIRTAAKAAVPLTLPSRYRGEVCAAVRRRLGLVMGNGSADDHETKEAEAAAAQWTVDSVAEYVAAEWSRIAAEDIPQLHALYLVSVEVAESAAAAEADEGIEEVKV